MHKPVLASPFWGCVGGSSSIVFKRGRFKREIPNPAIRSLAGGRVVVCLFYWSPRGLTEPRADRRKLRLNYKLCLPLLMQCRDISCWSLGSKIGGDKVREIRVSILRDRIAQFSIYDMESQGLQIPSRKGCQSVLQWIMAQNSGPALGPCAKHFLWGPFFCRDPLLTRMNCISEPGAMVPHTKCSTQKQLAVKSQCLCQLLQGGAN